MENRVDLNNQPIEKNMIITSFIKDILLIDANIEKND